MPYFLAERGAEQTGPRSGLKRKSALAGVEDLTRDLSRDRGMGHRTFNPQTTLLHLTPEAWVRTSRGPEIQSGATRSMLGRIDSVTIPRNVTVKTSPVPLSHGK